MAELRRRPADLDAAFVEHKVGVARAMLGYLAIYLDDHAGTGDAFRARLVDAEPHELRQLAEEQLPRQGARLALARLEEAGL